MNSHDIALLVYNVMLMPIVFMSFMFIFLAVIYLLTAKKKQEEFQEIKDFPFVTVQIPTFNDPVAERCIRKCLDFDYPTDRYEIIIADDSSDLQTQAMLRGYKEEYPERVKYIHRENREGFKPGALRNAMKYTRGDILVIFDADWIPRSDFLQKVIRPFADPTIAIVQTRQGFYNKDANIITRFAAYLLMIYHTIIMPINSRVNCVFFCGTAGAIRRSMFEEVGGWNLHSITEDSEITVKLLLKGYKTLYLEEETPSEVPDTLEGFIKQQMRWCYGNARVFFDNAGNILFGKGITLRQRAMILFVTLGNLAAPLVVVMTFFGFAGWFTGEPTLFQWGDIMEFGAKLLMTAGFLLLGILTLAKRRKLSEFPHMIASVLVMGIVLAVANTYAFTKAALNQKLHWSCTPKRANTDR